MRGEPLLLVLVVVALLVGVLIFLGPIFVARARNHPKYEAIFVCTILSLLLWPLWFVAAVWAHTVPPRQRQPRPRARRGTEQAAEALENMTAPEPLTEADVVRDEGSGNEERL